MGTLVNQQKSTQSSSQVKNSEEIHIGVSKDSSKQLKKVEKKLNKEYARIRVQFEDIRQAYKYAEQADSHDDLHFRLLQLERTTRRVRKGRIFTRGAKAHKRLLRSLSKIPIE